MYFLSTTFPNAPAHPPPPLPILFDQSLTFVLVHVNTWGVGPWGSPHFVLLGLANNCVDICV